jgi:lysine 6-dehydrogenase
MVLSAHADGTTRSIPQPAERTVDGSMKIYRYVVLGAGRQGMAAAYDLALRGAAESVVLADVDEALAQGTAGRLNAMLGESLVSYGAIDVENPEAIERLLEAADCVVSAVPYRFNREISRAAIAARCHMCDLGGNTELVRRQLALDDEARAAGVCLIPDCGQVPGMGTSLMVHTADLLDDAFEVRMWDGGIPLEPTEPWNYALTFNIGGLTNEYDGNAVFLRDGRPTEVPCFDPAGYETLTFPEPFGRLEAFVTAGGTSTMPWTFEGRLEVLENRTLRYPGHAAQWKAFSDAGLLGLEPVRAGSATVVPRELLHALMAPRLESGEPIRDAVLIRVVARGRTDGGPAEAILDLQDSYDEATGFTAMQRTTGWDVAIIASLMTHGRTEPGAVPREISVDPGLYVEELRRRGFDLRETVRPVEQGQPEPTT